MGGRPLFPPVFQPIVNHPMVDDFTLRAMRQRQTQQPQVPATYSLPLRSHPMWDGNNELGQEQAFAPDASNRQTVLKMGVWGPPQTWTLSLGINKVADVAQRWGVTAEVITGVGGATQTRLVDWVQGTTVVVMANAVQVNAIWRFDFAGDVRPTDARLSALIAQGNNTDSLPTLTQELIRTNPLAPAGQAAPAEIPRFAKYLTVSNNLNALGLDPATLYRFTPLPNTVNVDANWTAAQILASGNRIPIPPTSRYLIGSNAGLADGMTLGNAYWQIV